MCFYGESHGLSKWLLLFYFHFDLVHRWPFNGQPIRCQRYEASNLNSLFFIKSLIMWKQFKAFICCWLWWEIIIIYFFTSIHCVHGAHTEPNTDHENSCIPKTNYNKYYIPQTSAKEWLVRIKILLSLSVFCIFVFIVFLPAPLQLQRLTATEMTSAKPVLVCAWTVHFSQCFPEL